MGAVMIMIIYLFILFISISILMLNRECQLTAMCCNVLNFKDPKTKPKMTSQSINQSKQ